MRHKIDPKVDCVFKALLGSEDNKNLLIHFLNAILEPKTPIDDVYILDPFNAREFIGDKGTVVDVKARQEDGDWFQVEMQVQVHAFLSERQLFTWANLYRGQMKQGETYTDLRPAISIWLLNGVLVPSTPVWHHRFRAVDTHTGHQLSDHFAIHVLELPKWQSSQNDLDNAGQWMYFFKAAENWLELPEELETPEMEQAMSTLKIFSEKEIEYHRYLSRQDVERTRQLIEQTNKAEMERNKAQKLENQAEEEENQRRSKELAIEKEDLAAKKKDLATEKEDLATEKEDLATEKEDLATEKEDLAAKKKDLAAKKKDLAAKKKDLATEKEDLATEKEDLATEKEDLATEKEDLATEKEDLATEKEDLATEKQALTNQELELQAKARALREREAQIEQALAKLREQGLIDDKSE